MLIEEKLVRGHFTTRLKRHLKNYRLGMWISELKYFVLHTPRKINRLESKFVSVKPEIPARGNVLLCYNNRAFFLKPGEAIPNDHTSNWESLQIAETFLELGYQVDVIGENNDSFIPAKHYSVFVGNRTNFARIAQCLNKDCIKVLHIDTAHWLFHNTGEHQRLLALQQRRGFTLPTRRAMKPNLAIEHADCATILGNEFTIGTYKYANKPLHRLPISVPAIYPWPEDKDFEQARKCFLWFSSGGFVHKGLDLVLEAFTDLPDCHLTVCGPIDKEKDFRGFYHEMLYKSSNIHTLGWIDIASPRFLEIARNCIGVVYPSCSESGGGSVISCMHAGLIPIVSREASVDVNESFGVILKDCSIEEIKAAIKKVSSRSGEELKGMARKAWEFARRNHTRERFADEYRKVIAKFVTPLNGAERSCETTPANRCYSTATPVSDTGNPPSSLSPGQSQRF